MIKTMTPKNTQRSVFCRRLLVRTGASNTSITVVSIVFRFRFLVSIYYSGKKQELKMFTVLPDYFFLKGINRINKRFKPLQLHVSDGATQIS